MHDDRQGRRRGDENERGIPDGILLALLGFLLGLTILVWTATGLAGVLSHGAWPQGVTYQNTPLAMRSLASAPHDLAAAWPSTPTAELSGYGLFWGLAIGELMVLIVLTIFALGTTARWRAVRANRREAIRAARRDEARDEQVRGDRTGNGSPAVGAQESLPREAHTVSPGPYAEPAGPGPAHHPTGAPTAVVPGLPMEQMAVARPADTAPLAAPDPGVLPAPVPPPRAAAPRILYGDLATRRPTTLQAVLDAAGPALVVTSDPTVWAETKDARAKLGPVLVYDPGHLCDTPARLHWAPTAGCENADTATARAIALLTPVRPRALLDAAMADTAETLLRCWLHAAAVDGRPFKQVHRWAQGGGAQEAVRVLRTHPKAASGLAGLLESSLTAHPERREIAQQLVARALSALSSIHIREACAPNRTDSLALESFAKESGTLYLVGEPIEDPRTHPGAMPLLTALASDVVEHGRRMAARSSDGRLDPPMTLVLDDVAAVAPLPRLPDLLTTGQAQGLPTLALLRSAEQARARWPEPLTQ
ncbi:type IV secretory system conjugative DNA transfer family protein [Streptomyces sp. NBC_00467]|uniref:type IV secretory system conjugative DNA transfer family protein n=1 Tax=Streptomyces sp. NBC_00467 TaxID=2975752 RepID=UPI002E171A33